MANRVGNFSESLYLVVSGDSTKNVFHPSVSDGQFYASFPRNGSVKGKTAKTRSATRNTATITPVISLTNPNRNGEIAPAPMVTV